MMDRVMIAILVFLLMALKAETWQPWKQHGTCVNPEYISINITAVNSLVEPKFEVQIRVENQLRQTLIHFLERAVYLNGNFKFSVTYYAHLGFMVDMINHVTSNSSAKSYWEIISATNRDKPLRCGVSSYIPVDEEVILFNFTTW